MNHGSRALLAKNLREFMAKSPDLSSQPKLKRRSGISQATIGRILRAEIDAKVDTVDALARAFGLSGWQLLHPKPDVKAAEAEFYAKLRGLLDEAKGNDS